MPEDINNKQTFSLYEVTSSIQKTLSERYRSSFWVKAEMNKLNYYHHSGHCYPELVEKKNEKVIAQIRCNLWKDDYLHINKKFLTVLKEPLKDGIKILFLAQISFDPVYGLALRILDIDPSYTLGDIEKEKELTIHRLIEEGIFDRNKLLKLSVLPKRIAIISVETSKGYADFSRVLQSNEWGYTYFQMLFPSLLQGDKAVHSIIAQLRRIKTVARHFDAVAIIRGGGGDVGLSCYNNYLLAREVALYPLPVITGIGHATNETVVEMVSFQNAITPTKIAQFLLQQFHNFSVPVHKAEDYIYSSAGRILESEKKNLNNELKFFRSVTRNLLDAAKSQIKEHTVELTRQSKYSIRQKQELLLRVVDRMKKDSTRKVIIESQKLDLVKSGLVNKSRLELRSRQLALSTVERQIYLVDPVNTLNRGYSITRINGKVVRSVDQVLSEQHLITTIADGEILSISETIIKQEHS